MEITKENKITGVKSKYIYMIFGFIAAFCLSVIGPAVEDMFHNINMVEALSRIHHYYLSVFLGLMGIIFSYFYWKRRNQQIELTKALFESKKRLVAAQARAYLGSWELYIEKETGYWSDEMFRLFDRDPALGVPTFAEFLGYIHPLDREQVNHSYTQATIDRKAYFNEFRLIRPDGSIRWIEGRGEPGYDKDNKLIRLIGTAQDITERKLADEKLSKSEEKYRGIFENVQDVYYETSIDGTILEVSPSIEHIFKGQYHRNELIGKSIFDFYFNARERELIISILKEQGRVIDCEVTMKNKDGTQFFCSVSSKLMFDAGGKPDKIVGSMHDITERKNAEYLLKEKTEQIEIQNEKYKQINEELNKAKEKTEESEARLLILLEKAPIGIVSFDTNTVITSCNEYICKIINIPPEKLIGVNILATFRDAGQKEALQEALNGRMGIYEGGYTFDTGAKPCYICSTYAPLHDPDGSVIGGICITEDITIRKKAEEDLLNTKILLDETFEQCPIPMVLVSMPDAVLRIVNPACREFLGVEDEKSFVNTRLFDLKPSWNDYDVEGNPGSVESLPLARALQGKSTLNEERKIIRKDGTVRWELVSGVPIYNSKGELAAGYLVMNDITLKKIFEEELKESKSRYQTFFEQGHDGIVVVDPETASFIEFNNQVCIQLGYTREEFAKLKIYDIDVAETTEETKEHIKNIFLKGSDNFETKQRTKQGEIRDVIVSARVLEVTNKKIYLCIWRDISDQKRNEVELVKAKEKAEESDRLKTAFLQNISHEIRTPLNAIVGFSGILDKPELTSDKRKSFTTIIQNSSKQLLSIVSSILTISSLETKQEKPNIGKVCINSIIVDLLSIFKPQAQNQNISLYAKQLLTDQQSQIYTDNTKVTQILTNLLTNALKFTHEGYIEFGYKIVETGHALSLQFYVKDTGIGIEAELQDQIFERFRQADISISKKYGGTGLGLSISKGFIELLGGKIWVESKPGKGSTFYFTIPYNPVHEIDKSSSISIQNRNSATILIAEDEEYNYLYLEELLNKMGLIIIHAKDGQEAIEICKSNPDVALILMDIKMPVLDGYTAAIKIKEFRPNLPIVAQSAYALEHERKKFSGNAFDNYITKPINKNEFMQIIMQYIDKQYDKRSNI